METGILPDDPKRAAQVLKASSAFVITDTGLLGKFTEASTETGIALCIPKSLVPEALQLCHDTPWSAHQGHKATLRLAKQLFWWPMMSTDVHNHVRKCQLCVQHKQTERARVAQMGRRPPPEHIWQRLHVDHWTVGESHSGHKGVLAFIDAFSKFIILEPVKDYTAATVVEIFMARVATVYGLPDELYSDGGTPFTSRVSQAVFNATGVARHICVAWRPQANGQIERLFRTTRAMVATLCDKHPLQWPEMIPHVAFAYNTSFHRAVQNSPFYLMFGRDPTFRLTPAAGIFADRDATYLETLSRVGQAREAVKEMLVEQQKEYEHWYNQRKATRPADPPLRKGDAVWANAKFHPRDGTALKLKPRKVGPYRIVDMCNDIAWVVPITRPQQTPRRIHIDDLSLNHVDPVVGDSDTDRLNAPFRTTIQGLESSAEDSSTFEPFA